MRPRLLWSLMVGGSLACASTGPILDRSERLGPADERLEIASSLVLWTQFPEEFSRRYLGKVVAFRDTVMFREGGRDGEVSVRFVYVGDRPREVVARLNLSAWTSVQLERVQVREAVQLVCRVGSAGPTFIRMDDCEPDF